MSHSNSTSKSTPNKAEVAGQLVDVLYQKMGNRWFAFSLINDEVFVGSVSEDELNAGAPDPSALARDTANDSIVDDGVSPSRQRHGNA